MRASDAEARVAGQVDFGQVRAASGVGWAKSPCAARGLATSLRWLLNYEGAGIWQSKLVRRRKVSRKCPQQKNIARKQPNSRETEMIRFPRTRRACFAGWRRVTRAWPTTKNGWPTMPAISNILRHATAPRARIKADRTAYVFWDPAPLGDVVC